MEWYQHKYELASIGYFVGRGDTIRAILEIEYEYDEYLNCNIFYLVEFDNQFQFMEIILQMSN